MDTTYAEVDRLLADFETIRLGCDTFLNKLDGWVSSRKDLMKEAREHHEATLQANSVAESERKEATDMEVLASNLAKKKSEREKARDKIAAQVEALSNELRQRKQALKQAVEDREAELARNIPEMLCYEEKLAMTITGVKANILKFSFTHVNGNNWDEECSFVVDVSADKEYQIYDCQPMLPGLDDMVKYLNETPVTAVSSTSDGSKVVLGLANGHIWTLDVQEAENDDRITIQPKLLLLGHSSPVSVLKLLKLEVDGPVSRENVVLSASENGDVALWDLADGRALQANSKAIGGTPTGIELLSSGRYIVCAGRANSIVLLDSSTLEVAKTYNLETDWISALAIDTEDGHTMLLLGGVSGELWHLNVDESKTQFSKGSCYIKLPDASPIIGLDVSNFNSRIHLVLQRQICYIVDRKSFEILGTIPAPTNDVHWANVKLSSPSTVLLCAEDGTSYLYSLDAKQDFTRSTSKSIPPNAFVILSAAGQTIYTLTGTSSFTAKQSSIKLIASFQKPNCRFFSPLHLLNNSGSPSLPKSRMLLIAKGADGLSMYSYGFRSHFEKKNVILGSEISGVSKSAEIPLNVSYLQEIKLSDCMPLLKPSKEFITSSCLISSKLVALGFNTGKVMIFLITARLFSSPEDLKTKALFVLEGHDGPITSLCLVDQQNVGRTKILLSGGIDGTVRAWSLDDGRLISAFSVHSDTILSFVAVPPEAGMKNRSSVIAIAKDGSVSVLDLEDLRWSLKSGHLDRVETLEMAEDILLECPCSAPGEHVLTPPASPEVSREKAKAKKPATARQTLNTLAEIFKSGGRSRAGSTTPAKAAPAAAALKEDSLSNQPYTSYDDLSSEIGLEEDLKSVLEYYSSELPHLIGPEYSYPSLSFLAKYWQDQITDVQYATRMVFSSTLKGMPDALRKAMVEYWRAYLPAITSRTAKLSKMNYRAAIILGIVGSEMPELLSDRVCKDVAESVDILLKEDPRGPYRIVGIELISRGFTTWEPHINGSAVLRTVIQATGLSSTNTGSSSTSPSKDGGSGVSGVTASPALMNTARQAIVQIASHNVGLFITTITLDFAHGKTPGERIGSLKLLGMFISKKPLILYEHLHKVVESMIKALDPNMPTMREAVQAVVTADFAELVKTYPNVAFHHGSQRLAFGSPDGITSIYDLRTATRIQILEGHAKSVTAVAFSNDGKLIVTYSLEENSVRFWQLSGGFLNSLVGAFSGTGGGGPTAAFATVGGVGQMKSFRQFNVGPPEVFPSLSAVLESVKFDWVSDRSVKLFSIKNTELVFTV
ncbi:hypothetical protein HDV05_005271 [Chytridiales sp. JEL 0842]|nr:hypothetical protein HDV05_005271 [Chytridiales sp. JEL 0842]